MELTPATRRIAFVAIAGGLAALGALELGPVAHRGDNADHKPAAASSRPSIPARASARASATDQPDIYQWLPFTEAGLAAAAAIVVRFGDAYGTYSYTQDAAGFAAPLASVTSAALLGQIEAAYDAPGIAAARQSEQQVSVGAATVDSLRAFGPGSLTFVVQVEQQLTDSTGTSRQTTDYAVTVSGSGTSWQVTDVELASAGNS